MEYATQFVLVSVFQVTEGESGHAISCHRRADSRFQRLLAFSSWRNI
jgi:hypothetical protein